MAKATLTERARAYLEAMPPAIEGQQGHTALFLAACALVKGFGLPLETARSLLDEYNVRCRPPWSARDLDRKIQQADATPDDKPRGHLVGAGDHVLGSGAGAKAARPVWSPPKPVYDAERLRSFGGDLVGQVDLVWLANRSAVDPAEVDAEVFLGALYYSNQRVLVFSEVNGQGVPWTQGEALWPGDVVPVEGRCGVWFLPQPVDGEYHVNRRSGKTSRRSEESVVSWPFLVLESDDAPFREWLAALARLPLRIAAIYTSGGRSIHALVRVDGVTKGHWDEIVKRDMAPGLRFLVLNGADRGVFSAVRLSRLPGGARLGKMEGGRWVRFASPAPQKLLYLNPEPLPRPLVELPLRRDVVGYWTGQARNGVADEDLSGGEWIRAGLRYYARCSEACAAALNDMGGVA